MKTCLVWAGWLRLKAAKMGQRRIVWRLVAMLATVGVVGGCGGSHEDKAQANAAGGIQVVNPLHLPEAVARLAKLNIDNNTVFYIAASHCGEREPDCYQLSEETEESVRFGARTVRRLYIDGTGQQISHPGPAGRVLLFLAVHEECTGATPLTRAYGILHKVKDIVLARGGAHPDVFKKANIPSYMHPYGVLVYTLIPPGSNEVIVRTPSGQIVSRERGSMTRGRSSC